MVKNKILEIINSKYVRILLLCIIFVFAIGKRVTYFSQVGKDIYAYEKATYDLSEGVNPYLWTIESYSNPDDPGNHGYAYLPGFLYLFFSLYLVHLKTSIPLEILWKIPVLLADIGVGILLVKYFFKKNYLMCVAGVLTWFFNPYFFYKTNYVYSDPIPVFFMFLALTYLDKDDVLSGVFLAISIIFKTFSVVLIPIFLIRTKDKWKFLASMAIIGLFFSLPFLKSYGDFVTYLRGSIFVHGDRFVQGRPFLFYISYFYNIELFQIIPLKFYSLMSILFPFVLIPVLYFMFKVKDKYILSTAAFLNFYLFTPVLNRTYLIWFIPVFIVGAYRFVSLVFPKFKYIKVICFILILSIYWSFYYWYLVQWKDGFHIWRP